MWSIETLAVIVAAFLVAGLVKGMVGFGLPAVSLGILTVALGLKDAMALMVIPGIATNVWQAVSGGALVAIARRLWTLLAAAALGTWLGAGVLAKADAVVLSGVLGLLLCVYSAVSIASPQIPHPGRRERWLSPAVGAISGVITGLTGTFVVPAALYLQALALPRDVLVQALGVAFTVAMVSLAAALARYDILSAELGATATAALIPTLLGMALGRWVRRRTPERRFRQVFFTALLALGLYLAGRAFL